MAKAKKIKVMSLEEILIPMEEQPYDVPQNWCWTNISGVAELYTGNSINERVKKEKYLNQPEGLNFIATKDVEFDNSIVYDNGVKINDYDKFKTAPANTSLLCIEGGSAGRKLGFTREKVCFGNKLCAFVDKVCVPKYIYYYLQSNVFYNQFMNQRHGLIGGVSVKELSNIAIPVATLAEQQRIVEQIENLFAKLDEAKDKVQDALDGFGSRKNAVLYKAFSGELSQTWRESNNVLKDTWSTILLKELIVSGPQNGMYKEKSAYGNGTKILRIDGFYDGYIVAWDKLKRLTLNDEELELYCLNVNDIVINRVNSMPYLGKSALVRELPEECVYESNMMRIKIDESKVYPEYLIKYLNSMMGLQELRKNAKQAVNQASINQQDVKNVKVILPSLDEQIEIVRLMELFTDEEVQAKEKIEAAIEQIDLMKKSILAKAFRGELGTNNPDEESAVELLKSILATE